MTHVLCKYVQFIVHGLYPFHSLETTSTGWSQRVRSPFQSVIAGHRFPNRSKHSLLAARDPLLTRPEFCCFTLCGSLQSGLGFVFFQKANIDWLLWWCYENIPVTISGKRLDARGRNLCGKHPMHGLHHKYYIHTILPQLTTSLILFASYLP